MVYVITRIHPIRGIKQTNNSNLKDELKNSISINSQVVDTPMVAMDKAQQAQDVGSTSVQKQQISAVGVKI